MSTITRKLLAIGLGLVVALALPLLAFQTSGNAASLFHYSEGVASEVGPDPMYKRFGDVYTNFAVLGLSLAAGSAFALLAWPGTNAPWRVQAIFWILLALTLPLSVLNYWGRDSFVSRGTQALVDLVLVLLSTVAALNLARVAARETATVALRGIALFFIVFQGALIPALYATLWLLNWQSAISKADSDSFAPGWISAVCAVGSLCVSGAQYVLAKKKQETESSAHRPFRPRSR